MRSMLLALLVCAGLLGCAARDGAVQGDELFTDRPLETIPSLDVPRYMGTWYEIARYPNSFQKKCVSASTAEYSLMDDGRVRVVNRCRLADGGLNEAVAVARQLGEATSPRLKVRFAPAWLSFLPAVWGDYWVIDLDEDYQLVAISEPNREYLWILSRAPQVDPERYAQLLSRLLQKGFDPGRLIGAPALP